MKKKKKKKKTSENEQGRGNLTPRKISMFLIL
jgi:hypothetical protein